MSADSRTIRLIHWNEPEARERAKILSGFNYKVEYKISPGPQFIKEIQANLPAVFIIDLTRLPSQGRDMALIIRQKKATRNVPVIFVGGEKEKVDQIKKLLPDAFYTDWDKIQQTIEKAVSKPMKEPVVHKSVFAAYEGVSLAKKLGIKPNSTLMLINPPKDFEKNLGNIPKGLSISKSPKAKSDLIIWFAKSQSEVEKRIKQISNSLTEKGSVWIAWAKKSSGVETDLTQVVVRKIGLASGIVDYKICSIDKTWSALLFTRRKTKG